MHIHGEQVPPRAPRTPYVRPDSNIALIVIDDIGIDQLHAYDDVNQYSMPYAYANTPNLDALAASGMRFRQARAAPLCSPARSMLLTGRFPFRTGCGALVTQPNQSPNFVELGNPIAETVLPSLLPGRRAAFGKWHLGCYASEGGTMPNQPVAFGFESWQGVVRNLAGDIDHPPGMPGYRDYWWWLHGAKSQQTDFATGYTRTQASRWVKLSPQPFFLYAAFHAAHSPYTAGDVPPTSEHGFGNVPGNYRNTIYRALIESLDYQLGILLADMPANTTVFVIGDNGTAAMALRPAASEPRYPLGHPLHQVGDDIAPMVCEPYVTEKAKGTVYDVGIRVPLLVSGPQISPGVSDALVGAVDLFATIAEIKGVTIPEGVAQDSVSFNDLLAGQTGPRDFAFTEHTAPNGANQPRVVEDRAYIRQAGVHLWKLVRRLDEPDEFYDVAADPLELTDLGTGHAEYQATVDEMLELLAS